MSAPDVSPLPSPPSHPPGSSGKNNSNNNGGSGPSGSKRPSDARRNALQEALKTPYVSNFFPIDNYYNAADTVYQSFQDTFQDVQNGHMEYLDDAYVYGKRYCWFCVHGIPNHNYYNLPKYKNVKVRHIAQIDQVLKQLEKIAEWMDQEEEEKIQKQQEEKRKREAALERKRTQQLKEWQAKLETQKQGASVAVSSDVQASALSKLAALSGQQQPPTAPLRNGLKQRQQQVPLQAKQDDEWIRRDPSGEEPMGVPSSRYRFQDSSDDDEGILPPPILPPLATSEEEDATTSTFVLPPPPSYNQIQKTTRSSQEHFLGPAAASLLQPMPPTVSSYATPTSSSKLEELKAKRAALAAKRAKEQPKRRIPMRQLQNDYRQAYLQYQQAGKIQVSGLATYQGRIGSSTNGCTVISALCAAKHLRTNGPAITNDQICAIIDRECGPLLNKIRGKLGLGGHALIIPSDVHDHLVDCKILQQSDFEGAAGGNVIDEAHIAEFFKLLSVGDNGKGAYKRAAATLFFREHVISIVKTVAGRNQVYYDLIDSLPGMTSSSSMMATRTRCHDLDSLKVLLRWYTSRKLSDTNCTYIDNNTWDDAMADFDPRVFQGFVWMVDRQ